MSEKIDSDAASTHINVHLHISTLSFIAIISKTSTKMSEKIDSKCCFYALIKHVHFYIANFSTNCVKNSRPDVDPKFLLCQFCIRFYILFLWRILQMGSRMKKKLWRTLCCERLPTFQIQLVSWRSTELYIQLVSWWSTQLYIQLVSWWSTQLYIQLVSWWSTQHWTLLKRQSAAENARLTVSRGRVAFMNRLFGFGLHKNIKATESLIQGL
jgi:hypothetical protein